MKRRLLAALLSLALVVGLFPATALAEEGTQDGGVVVPCTVTESCTLEAGHDGDCIILPDEPEEPIDEEPAEPASSTAADQLAELLSDLSDPSDIAGMDDAQLSAVQEQIAAIEDFALKNSLTLTEEQTALLTAIWSALTSLPADNGTTDEVSAYANAITATGGELSSGEYELTDNVTLNNALIIPEGAIVSIDLNGKTISTGEGFAGTSVLSVAENASLTIRDGSIEGTGTIHGTSTSTSTIRGVEGNSGSTVNIEGGTIDIDRTGSADKYAYGVYMDDTQDNPSTLNISGGKIDVYSEKSITCGVYLKFGNISITGKSEINVRTDGTTASYGVRINNPNSKATRSIDGGTVTITGAGIVYGISGYYGEGINISDCVVTAKTTGANKKAYSVYNGIVSEGTFRGEVGGSTTITGGTFLTSDGSSYSDVSGKIPAGYPLTQNQETGEIMRDEDAVIVATANGQEFTLLSTAIAAAEDGSTVILRRDTDPAAEGMLTIDKDITLDLGENTLKLNQFEKIKNVYGSGYYFQVSLFNSGDLTIQNGTVALTYEGDTSDYLQGILNKGDLTLADDVAIVADVPGAAVMNVQGTLTSYADISNVVTTVPQGGANAVSTYGGTLNLLGGEITASAGTNVNYDVGGVSVFNSDYSNTGSGAQVEITNVRITSDILALSTNNQASGGDDPSNVTIKSGTLTAANSTAIYWPSAGTLTVGEMGGSDDSVVIKAENGSGIEICSGTLVVNCGTISGETDQMTKTDSETVTNGYGGSGAIGVGDAITAVGRRGSGYNSAPLNVTINGGTLTSDKNYAVRYFDYDHLTNNDDVTGQQDVAVRIVDGNFVGSADTGALEFEYVAEGNTAKEQQVVSGGNFSDSVDSAYLAPTLTYEVKDNAAGNQAPFSYTTTLDEAMEAAGEDGEITSVAATNTESDDNSTFTVTIANESVSNQIKVAENETIILPTPDRGSYWHFQGWRADNGTVHQAGGTVRITADITFTARWDYVPPVTKPTHNNDGDPTYSISLPGKVPGGEVSLPKRYAEQGETVIITVKPDSGYVLETLTVTDANGDEISVRSRGNNQYTFTMPRSRVTIEATFAEIEEEPDLFFVDVPTSAYYYDAVYWAAENGVTYGTSATTFSPDVIVSRAQMVTFLWRAHGSPAPRSSVNPFTDITSDMYYYDAVLWAVENGVTNGTSATTFSPDATVTRAQAVTFQWRAAGSPAVSGGSFADVADSAYYVGAVSWAVANGVTNGTGGSNFSPDVGVSRAQAVTFLWRQLA